MTERFDDVLAEAEVLTDLDAARAEVWASGLVAEYDDPAELLALLAAHPGATTAAIACALAPMIPESAAVVAQFAGAGVPLPAWADAVGTAAGCLAWEIIDPFSGNASIVVEYEHGDAVRHTMLVEIEEAAAVDIQFGPAGLVDDAFAESDTRALSVREIDVAAAHTRIRNAFIVTQRDDDADVTDEFLMNAPLAWVRAELHLEADASVSVAPSLARASSDAHTARRPERSDEDRDADARAAVTLRSALARQLTTAAPADDLAVQAARVRASLNAGDDADLAALAVDSGVIDADQLDDARLLAMLAGAFVVPGYLAAFGPTERTALRSLEWADWLGAVIPLVREGAGADASPAQLVTNINRCGEVTTTIPKRDQPAVAEVFSRTLHAWELTGVIDDDSRLRPLGAWLLPRALLGAWSEWPD